MRARSNSGFTLIELMIVVSIILIIAAIAIPLFIRSRMQSHEASAIASLRTISSAQEQFRTQGVRDDNSDGVPDYGDLIELAESGPSGPGFIDSALGSGIKSGYFFEIEVFAGDNVDPPRYSARAFPVSYSRTGVRNFYVDQEGVIRFTRGTSGAIGLGPDSAPL